MNHQASAYALEPQSLLRTRHGVGLLVLGTLPFLLILACPLMHWMHGHGHGGHGWHRQSPGRADNDRE